MRSKLIAKVSLTIVGTAWSVTLLGQAKTSARINAQVEQVVPFDNAKVVVRLLNSELGKIVGNADNLTTNSISTKFDKDKSILSGSLLFQLSENDSSVFSRFLIGGQFSGATDGPFYLLGKSNRPDVKLTGAFHFLVRRPYAYLSDKFVDDKPEKWLIHCSDGKLPVTCDSIWVYKDDKKSSEKQDTLYRYFNWISLHSDYNNEVFRYFDKSVPLLTDALVKDEVKEITWGVSMNWYHWWNVEKFLPKSRARKLFHSLLISVGTQSEILNNKSDLNKLRITTPVVPLDTSSNSTLSVIDERYYNGKVEYEQQNTTYIRTMMGVKKNVFLDIELSQTTKWKLLQGTESPEVSDKAKIGLSVGMAFFASNAKEEAIANGGLYLVYDDIKGRPGLVFRTTLPLNFGFK